MERASVALPNLAEAWDILGNLYLHVGGLMGRDNWAELARRAFTRAQQLDATVCVCAADGLAELAFLENDVKSFEKYSSDRPWDQYLRALMKRAVARIPTTRILYARDLAVAAVGPNLTNGLLPPWLAGFQLPRREVDSLLVILDALANDARQRSSLARWTMVAASFAGQPERAGVAARSIQWQDSASFFAGMLELNDRDSVAARRLASVADPRSQHACDAGLWRLRHDDTTGVASFLAAVGPTDQSVDRIIAGLRPRGQALVTICAHVLNGVMASREPAGGPLLRRADSLMRYMPRNCCDKWNYDLAVAFGRRGEYAMAADAARRYARDIAAWAPLAWSVPALRLEGQSAAASGDTVAAVKAYKSYLVYREKPEPSMIPQRDSVLAELDALDRARRRRSP
jgi:hypothetical protein